MPETKTRTVKSSATPKQAEVDDSKARAEAKKAEQNEAKAAKVAEAEQEKAAKADERAKAKAEADATKAAEKAEKEAEKVAAKEAKVSEAAAERQELIDSGAIIENNDELFTEVVEFKKDLVASRAHDVIEILKASDTPVRGSALAEQFGGGTVQWVAFFGMLRSLELIKVYRASTGVRGGGGLAYMWIGDES